MFPPLGPREASQGVQPLDASETRASADVPVAEDVDLDDKIDRLPDKRPLEEVPVPVVLRAPLLGRV